MKNFDSKQLGIQKKKVAFITDSPANSPFAQRILSGVAKHMQKRRGFILRTILFSQTTRYYLTSEFDGIIINLCAENTHKLLKMLKGTTLPIVDTAAEIENPSLIRVDLDIVREGTMAAEWFLRRSFRNLAYCGFHGVATYPFSDILEGAFASVAKRAGCQYMTFTMPSVAGNNRQYLRVVQRALNDWAATLPPRTAVFCVQDRRAVMLTQACLTCGRAVPEDIAIMGRNNDIITCSCAPVPISSVNSNLEGQGYAAMRILEDSIRHPVAPRLRPTFRIPPLGIVERESTAVYPVNPPFLAKALLLLDDSIECPLPPKSLASAVGVSTTTLRSAFKKVLGTSLAKYALSARMREATRLLKDERLSTKEVATKTGFTSQSYFSTAYRAFYGHPPNADRRK